MPGELEIRGSSIIEIKNGKPVNVIECAVEDPSALILDAVCIGKAGPFEITQRQGKDVILLNGGSPFPALPLIRAALNVVELP